jgi:hypothetical protein
VQDYCTEKFKMEGQEIGTSLTKNAASQRQR